MRNMRTFSFWQDRLFRRFSARSAFAGRRFGKDRGQPEERHQTGQDKTEKKSEVKRRAKPIADHAADEAQDEAEYGSGSQNPNRPAHGSVSVRSSAAARRPHSLASPTSATRARRRPSATEQLPRACSARASRCRPRPPKSKSREKALFRNGWRIWITASQSPFSPYRSPHAMRDAASAPCAAKNGRSASTPATLSAIGRIRLRPGD